MKNPIFIMLLCAFLNTSCNVGLHYLDDRTLEHWLITEQEERRAELQGQGASEEEISKAMLGIERRHTLLVGWERPTLKKYLTITLASTAAGLLIGWAIYLFFVRKKYRKSILVITVLFILSGGIWRTFLFVTDTRFLITALMMERQHYGYFETGFLISPDVALFILTRMPWLHFECGYWSRNSNGCDREILHSAIALFDENDESRNAYARIVIEWLVERGEDINVYDDGFTLVHVSVLYGNVEALELLIDLGADLTKPVNRPGKLHDEMTPLEFARFLDSAKKVSRRQIIEILEPR